jgi:hypothetical protein
VLVFTQLRHDLVDLPIHVACGFRGSADDERGTSFVDEDRVHLVDDGEVQRALRVVERRELHVVAQVVEAEFVVLAVTDVRLVSAFLLGVGLLVDDDPDAEAKPIVEPPHPLGVAAREVVVYGNQMNALAFESVEVDRQGGDEGLTFTRLHFRDGPAVQDHAAHQLNVVMTHAQDTTAGFTTDRKRLELDVVQRSAVIEFFFELPRLGLEFRVAELLDASFQRVDLSDAGLQAFQGALIGGAKQFARNVGQHGSALLNLGDMR